MILIDLSGVLGYSLARKGKPEVRSGLVILGDLLLSMVRHLIVGMLSCPIPSYPRKSGDDQGCLARWICSLALWEM